MMNLSTTVGGLGTQSISSKRFLRTQESTMSFCGFGSHTLMHSLTIGWYMGDSWEDGNSSASGRER